VPEPASALFIGLGLATLATQYQARKRTKSWKLPRTAVNYVAPHRHSVPIGSAGSPLLFRRG
jgi:hypothetical protein